MIKVNSYSGHKYNIFYHNYINDKGIMIGSINLMQDGLFHCDLLDECDVFVYRVLSECLIFYEDISVILFNFKEDEEDFSKIKCLNVYQEGLYINDTNIFVGSILDEGTYYKFTIFNFSLKLYERSELDKIIKIYVAYLIKVCNKMNFLQSKSFNLLDNLDV